MEQRTYYEVLGVEATATRDQIQRAYRALARKLHPDTSAAPDADAHFRELSHAYQTLRDAKKRRAYDASLEEPLSTEPGAGPHFSWSNIASSEASVAWAEEERRERQTEFDEMYDAFFGARHDDQATTFKKRTQPPPPV